jgi:hypothetical protein
MFALSDDQVMIVLAGDQDNDAITFVYMSSPEH